MSNSEDLKSMIYSFRVSELQDLLGFAGRNKIGKKQELQARALDLLKLRKPSIQMKILELHKRRFQVMSMVPTQPQQPSRQNTVPSVQNSVNPSHAMPRNNILPGNMNYGAGMNYSAAPVKPLSLLTAGPSTSRASVYPVHPDVKFKDLPFFDVLSNLLQPSSLSPSGNSGYQESHFQFHLSPHQVDDINASRMYPSVGGSGNEYNVQIQLRFCLLETSCEQEDNFPPSICVKVNGRTCALPNPIPTNRPGVEPKRPNREVNITPYCRLSSTTPNNMLVSWASDFGHRAYVVAVFLVRRLDSSVLLSRLRSKGMRNPDYTRAMIKEKLMQSPDSEIATTSLRGSLMCPIGKMKMQIPCRPVTCTHLQCFDANLFLKMNEKKPRWICPVCDKSANFGALFIDGLFSEISAKAPSRCTEVQFHEDGSWTPIIQETKAHDVDNSFVDTDSQPQKKRKDMEVIDLTLESDSEEEEDWSRPSTSFAQKPQKMFKPSPSSTDAVGSSSVMYQPKISSTAPFISLSSPSSPSLNANFDNLASAASLSASDSSSSSVPPTPFPLPHTLMKAHSPVSTGGTVLPNKIEPHPSSSHDIGYGGSVFPNMNFVSSPFYSPAMTPPAVPSASSHCDMASTSQAYSGDDGFNLYSLLQANETEQTTDGEKSAGSAPDIISLD